MMKTRPQKSLAGFVASIRETRPRQNVALQKQTPRRGFTLVELLTVIVIISMLLVIAVPVMTRLTRASALNNATRQVSNAATLARQYAITQRINTELRITNTYNAVAVYTNNFPLGKWEFFPPGVFVDPKGSVTNIHFRPTGGTTATSNETIVVREAAQVIGVEVVGTNQNFATITVGFVLGKVTVDRP